MILSVVHPNWYNSLFCCCCYYNVLTNPFHSYFHRYNVLANPKQNKQIKLKKLNKMRSIVYTTLGFHLEIIGNLIMII